MLTMADRLGSLLRKHAVPVIAMILTVVWTLFLYWFAERERIKNECRQALIVEPVDTVESLTRVLAREITSAPPGRPLEKNGRTVERYPDFDWNAPLHERNMNFRWYSALSLFVIYEPASGAIVDHSLIYYYSEPVDLSVNVNVPYHRILYSILAGFASIVGWYALQKPWFAASSKRQMLGWTLGGILVMMIALAAAALLLPLTHFSVLV